MGYNVAREAKIRQIINNNGGENEWVEIIFYVIDNIFAKIENEKIILTYQSVFNKKIINKKQKHLISFTFLRFLSE